MEYNELIKRPAFILSEIQMKLYTIFYNYYGFTYKYEEKNNRKLGDIAKKFEVSRATIHSILNGDFNGKLSDLVEIANKLDYAVKVDFEKIIADNAPFIDAIVEAIKPNNIGLRRGQYIFNELNKRFPTQTDTLRGTDVDCFYDDSKIDSFITQLKLLVKN